MGGVRKKQNEKGKDVYEKSKKIKTKSSNVANAVFGRPRLVLPYRVSEANEAS
jgi:hypothetical protein